MITISEIIESLKEQTKQRDGFLKACEDGYVVFEQTFRDDGSHYYKIRFVNGNIVNKRYYGLIQENSNVLELRATGIINVEYIDVTIEEMIEHGAKEIKNGTN